MEDTLVFVYGTLKKGYGNNRLLAGAEFVGEAVTLEKFKVAGRFSFPTAKKNEEGNWLSGEVWRVNANHMRDMDRLEGNGHFYNREEIPVYRVEDAAPFKCWMYIYMGQLHEGDLLAADKDGIITWAR